jgi:hypothetical protein
LLEIIFHFPMLKFRHEIATGARCNAKGPALRSGWGGQINQTCANDCNVDKASEGTAMASRPTIVGRGTSLAAAFVHAIIPRRIEKDAQSELYNRFGIDAAECVYCDRVATDKDHFRAIVKDGKPSGYFHTTDNVVPSCGPCNQSKGGSDWLAWMTSIRAKGSPTKRAVPGTSLRIERLSKFAQGAETAHMSDADMRNAVGEDLWTAYWARLAAIKVQMAEAQKEAEKIRALLETAFARRSM